MRLKRDKLKNFVGKQENAGFQHFLLFPHCFQHDSFSGSLKAFSSNIYTIISSNISTDVFKYEKSCQKGSRKLANKVMKIS